MLRILTSGINLTFGQRDTNHIFSERQIYTDARNELVAMNPDADVDEYDMAIPVFANARSQIRHHLNKEKPAEPKTRAEIDLTDRWTTTKDSPARDFLIKSDVEGNLILGQRGLSVIINLIFAQRGRSSCLERMRCS